MHPHTESILKPLFDKMNKAYSNIAIEKEKERLFEATEGREEVRQDGKKNLKQDDRED